MSGGEHVPATGGPRRNRWSCRRFCRIGMRPDLLHLRFGLALGFTASRSRYSRMRDLGCLAIAFRDPSLTALQRLFRTIPPKTRQPGRERERRCSIVSLFRAGEVDRASRKFDRLGSKIAAWFTPSRDGSTRARFIRHELCFQRGSVGVPPRSRGPSRGDDSAHKPTGAGSRKGGTLRGFSARTPH